MKMIKTLMSFYIDCAEKMRFVPQLLTRIVIGWVFIESGWGKLNHLDKVIGFFTSLGIPAPQLQAPFVASVEFLGGFAILVGFATRLASIPLIGVMTVALITAKQDDIKTFSDLFAISEFLYIPLLLWLITNGAGKLSIDHFIKSRHHE